MGIINEKAIAYWDFRSGHTDDLISDNDATFTTGSPHFNREGLVFDGNSYMSVPDSRSLDFTGTFTVSALCKTTGTRGRTIIAGRNGVGATYTWLIYQPPTANNWDCYIKTASGISSTGVAAVNLGEWVVITAVYDRTLPSSRLKLYFNNTQVAATNGYDEDITSQVGLPIDIGKYVNYLEGNIACLMLSDEAFTTTEISQLNGEMRDTVWPTKPKAKSHNTHIPDSNDSSLVGAWNLKPLQNSIIDFSGNGNNGTITGQPVTQENILGDAMYFDGTDDYIDIGSTSQTVNTVSFWIKPTTTSEDIIDLDGGTHTIEVSSGTLTATGFDTPTIYVDGNVSSTLVAGLWQHVVITTAAGFTASDLDIGKETTYFDGYLADIKIYNEVKNSGWVTKQYEKGASVVQYKTDWGARVSSANISSGEIENTGWYVNSGNWQIGTDTINGEEVKVLACHTDNGIVFTKSGDMGQSDTEAAYGTWEWYWYHYDGNNIFHIMINDEVSTPAAGTANGYVFRLGTAERWRLRKETAGSIIDLQVSAAGTFNVGQWYKMKVTRSATGEFSVYVDDTLLTMESGTNPITDNTFTTAPYFSIQARATDMIAFADKKGQKGIIKRLGVD